LPGDPGFAVDFDGTQVEDSGMTALKMLKIRYLNLRDTRVGDTGLKHLEGQKDLRDLDMSGTEISDAGLAHLKSLRGLKRLILAYTYVSDC
jgi:hypothetical protein